MGKKTEYVTDPSDGMRAMVVGRWGEDKYKYLRHYVQSASGARAKFTRRAYVDTFCGPGRVKYSDTGEFADGGAIAAWRQSFKSKSPFTQVFISDADGENVRCCEARLKALGANVVAKVGRAVDLAPIIARELPYGQHLAFLDPFSLGALPFEAIKPFAAIKKLDLIVNYSAYDQTRNILRMRLREIGGLDAFAPGWDKVISPDSTALRSRLQLMDYWRNLLVGVGMKYSEEMPEMRNSKKGLLYWLVFAAHHPFANKLWDSITDDGQGDLFSQTGK